MISDVKKLSNEAPIILTWVPGVHGASLPDGKNSNLNYLDIIKNHKLKNKEERSIYLVINGPGFEQNQIDDLKRELKEIKGVHVVDLHQYDWHKIDQGWKIDGKDISINDFFKNMYDMTDEQRTYFAIEIDTFRLIAFALSEKMTGQKGAIYVDFDSLKNIDTHIGKDITIPEKILLGIIEPVFSLQEKIKILLVTIKPVFPLEEKVTALIFNNNLIAISDSSVAVGILSEYQDKILGQKEICSDIKKRLPLSTDELLDKQFAKLKEEKEVTKEDIEEFEEHAKKEREAVSRYINDLENRGIAVLYDTQHDFQCYNSTTRGFNLCHIQIHKALEKELMGKETSKFQSFNFPCNNGKYVFDQFKPEESDRSWMEGEDLYHKQVDNKLERAKVEHSLGEPPKVVSGANVSSVEDLKLKVNNPR